MGAASAKKHARIHLESFRPDRVITAGFAGALRKEHRNGDLVLDADDSFIPPPEWSRAGWIRRGRFLCVPRLAATAAAKHEWARSSGADAIEMESEVIRSICHSMGIPSATLRVISDELDEDLPLDFSQFMDEQQRMRWMALFGYITKHPEVIPQLMAFRRRLADAAGRLALALGEACGRPAIK